jgi:hypothetical protein
MASLNQQYFGVAIVFLLVLCVLATKARPVKPDVSDRHTVKVFTQHQATRMNPNILMMVIMNIEKSISELSATITLDQHGELKEHSSYLKAHTQEYINDNMTMEIAALQDSAITAAAAPHDRETQLLQHNQTDVMQTEAYGDHEDNMYAIRSDIDDIIVNLGAIQSLLRASACRSNTINLAALDNFVKLMSNNRPVDAPHVDFVDFAPVHVVEPDPITNSNESANRGLVHVSAESINHTEISHENDDASDVVWTTNPLTGLSKKTIGTGQHGKKIMG